VDVIAFSANTGALFYIDVRFNAAVEPKISAINLSGAAGILGLKPTTLTSFLLSQRPDQKSVAGAPLKSHFGGVMSNFSRRSNAETQLKFCALVCVTQYVNRKSRTAAPTA
jgi:hypothetical protein